MTYRKSNKTKRMSRACRNNGPCSYCRGSRLHSTRKRALVASILDAAERDVARLKAAGWKQADFARALKNEFERKD